MTVKELIDSYIPEMIDLASYAFTWEATEHNKKRFTHLAKNSWNYGSFADGALVSQVMATPFKVGLQNERYSMAGVGFVATYPEYRKEGRIDQIMAQLLKDCYERQVELAYLAPFSQAFYRRYGFEMTFNELRLKAQVTDWQISNYKPTGKVKRLTWEKAQPLIERVYQEGDLPKRGGLIRESWWYRYKFALHEQLHYGLYFDQAGQAQGYVVYEIKGGQILIKEMQWLNYQAFKELQQFVAGHAGTVSEIVWQQPDQGQADFLLQESPKDQLQVQPFMMARIVDLEKFLKKYPLAPGAEAAFVLEISDDPYAPWNVGLYEYQPNEGFKKVTSSQAAKISGSMQSFTQVLLGYQKVSDLTFKGLLKGRPNCLDDLAKLVVKDQPILADYF